MKCPRCGSEHLQVITESEGNVQGYGFGKGCLGRLILGPIGWMCGLCGAGKQRYRSKSYWICNQCGNKFRT